MLYSFLVVFPACYKSIISLCIVNEQMNYTQVFWSSLCFDSQRFLLLSSLVIFQMQIDSNEFVALAIEKFWIFSKIKSHSIRVVNWTYQRVLSLSSTSFEIGIHNARMEIYERESNSSFLFHYVQSIRDRNIHHNVGIRSKFFLHLQWK